MKNVIYMMRIGIFVMLIAGTLFEWRKARLQDQLIALQKQTIESLERIIRAQRDVSGARRAGPAASGKSVN